MRKSHIEEVRQQEGIFKTTGSISRCHYHYIYSTILRK